MKRGFTLVEVLVGTALFLVVATAVYSVYVSLLHLANTNQAEILGVELADEQMEIVRNMPFTSVGLTNGIPLGVLPQNQTLVRGGFTFNVTLVIRNEDLSTSTVQVSSKLIEVDVTCASCQTAMNPIALTGQVSPANLQSASTGGALVVQVFDANAVPIQGATVVIQSTVNSLVTDTDITNNSGVLQVVGVPPGTKVYHITATKAGYTTASTYTPGVGNPNPNQPDATVVKGAITQVSLAIDKVSSLSFSSLNASCGVQPNLGFNLVGTKQIGQNLPKYSQSLTTNGSGSLSLSSMEWDTYTVGLASSGSYDLAGITPFSPFQLNPSAALGVQLVAVPKNPNSLLVAVADSSTGLPVSGATVTLSNGSGYNQFQKTGQGYFDQTDWSGGSGQSAYSTANKYWADDGLVNVSSAGNVTLKKTGSNYPINATGTLESSTFDTGTTSNFYTLNWIFSNPSGSAGATPVKIQIATAASTSPNGPWVYLGPDGTPNTYYSAPGTQISSANNNAEFVRYEVNETTKSTNATPTVSDISFTFTSGCVPPGQVLFQWLATGTYKLVVSAPGYANFTNSNVSVASGWQMQTVTIGP